MNDLVRTQFICQESDDFCHCADSCRECACLFPEPRDGILPECEACHVRGVLIDISTGETVQ